MSEKKTVLVSACLLGVNCRYDGKNGRNEEVCKLLSACNVIPVCPEQLGGLKTPRSPAERCQDGTGRIVNRDGVDVTGEYKRGAEEALGIAEIFKCRLAVLKERSPSCGCGMIYDGTFSGRLIAGDGLTAELFRERGIKVVGESRVLDLMKEEGLGKE